MSDTETTFLDRCVILGDLWMNYRGDEEFSDFIEYNDLGLPLAYALGNSIVDTNETATNFVNETWNLFLEGLGIEDSGFTNLDEVLGF
jgi:hypothetical protein